MGRFTGILIVANIIMFLLMFSMPEEMMENALGMMAFSSVYILQIWRIFTSLFVHASASHLFFNMLGLYFFGKTLEDEVSPKTFLLIYFLAGIVGNLAFGMVTGDAVVGASGCVFGLMGAAMLLKPKSKVNFYVFPLPLGIVAVVFAVVESMLVYFGTFATGVAHMAHVGGLAVGVFFAFRHNKKQAGKGILWLILFVAIIIILGPVFSFVIDIGNFILGLIDFAVGVVLYSLASLLGFLW
ncbi:MAG: rhomboid family intramembrane serine protease [Candidatus Aenigmarchaeota archaeon]|nr:rhomboid family intramembrane serine protease [Candidatus Aenigmarchaeota archaeon]